MEAKLVCPKCKGQVKWCNAGAEMWCEKCKLVISNYFVSKAFLEGVSNGERKRSTEIRRLLDH